MRHIKNQMDTALTTQKYNKAKHNRAMHKNK